MQKVIITKISNSKFIKNPKIDVTTCRTGNLLNHMQVGRPVITSNLITEKVTEIKKNGIFKTLEGTYKIIYK